MNKNGMSKREKERSDEGVRTISKRMKKEEKYCGKTVTKERDRRKRRT